MSEKLPASMTGRLVIGFGGSFAIIIIFSGTVLYALLAKQLKLQRELSLKDKLQAISVMLNSTSLGFQDLQERVQTEWPSRGGEKVFVKVFNGDHTAVLLTPGQESDLGQDGVLRDTKIFSNTIGIKNPVVAEVAIGNQQSQEFLNTVRELLSVVLIFSLLSCWFAGWEVVRRAMAPLQMIASQVSEIDSQNLHQRIDHAHLPTELLSLAQAFNSTFDRLEESFTRLSQFSSDLAHELRTPLTNIMGSIEVALNRSRSDEDYREVLESNLDDCSRLSSMCDSLLFLARAENRRQALALSEVSVQIEIERLIEFFEPLSSEKNIAVTFTNLISPAMALFRLEKTLFQRALDNLLANAIRYSPKGGKIEISCSVSGETNGTRGLTLIVRDYGSGIAEKDLPFIFDRFYRADPSRHASSGGSGLGLAIVKSIVELHDGKITVESTIGIGTQFTVILPDSAGPSRC